MKGVFMQKNIYHNRNGNIHSEESREHYLEEVKSAEHELKDAKEFVIKNKNEDYEHYKTERFGDAYHIKMKKRGKPEYKEFVIEYGENYSRIKELL